MKYIFLFGIRCYWLLIPERKRRKCIYKQSCSRYVFEQLKTKGMAEGYRAFIHRSNRCNPYFQLFVNPMTTKLEIILSTGEVLEHDHIAQRLTMAHDPTRASPERGNQ